MVGISELFETVSQLARIEIRITVSGIMLTLLLFGVFASAFNVQPVSSDWIWTRTIHIGADGSVYPSDAPISTFDNITYTLTDSIVGNIPHMSNAIVVERDNIVLDGAGYTVQGAEIYRSNGINLTGRSNVTIKNMIITEFFFGIWLEYSNNNTIVANNIISNFAGIRLWYSSNNSIVENIFTDDGLEAFYSYGNLLEDNLVNGKPIIYLEGVAGVKINATEPGQIILINCDNIQLENLNISHTVVGIELWNTTNTKIIGNNITSNPL